MKKLLALLLALMLVFSVTLSLTACGDDACDEHVDKDKDGICDKCDEELEDKGGNGLGLDLDTEKGEAFFTAVLAQMAAVKSVKVEGEFDFTIDMSGDGETEYAEGEGSVELIASLTDSAIPNMQLNVSVKFKNAKTASYETETVSAYIIDGFAYLYDTDAKAYLKTAIEGMSEDDMAMAGAYVEQMLGMLPEFSEDDIKTVKGVIGGLFIEIFNLKDNKASLKFDLVPTFNKVKEFANGLNFKTTTVEKFINEAFVLLGIEDLTVEDILNEFARFAVLPVNEALDELDAFLTEKCGKDLQGIYDAIMNDKYVEELFVNVFVATSPEMKEEDAMAMLEQFRAIKIADIITELGVGDTPLITLVFGAVSGSQPTPGVSPMAAAPAEPTPEELVEQLVTMAERYLAVTLEEIDDEFDGGLSYAIEVINGINVKAFETEEAYNFADGYKLVDVTTSANFDIEAKIDGINAKIKESYSIKASDFSTTAKKIALPEGAVVIENK